MADAVPPSVYPPPPPAPRRGRPASFWVAVILAVVLVGSLLVNLLVFAAVGAVAAAGDEPGRREWAEKHVDGHGRDKIALIELRGVITSNRGEGLFGDHESMVERIEGQLAQARRDDQVKAVVLAIESPGGEVTASDALHDQVEQVGSSRVDLQACKLEYSIVSPK